MTLAAAYGAPCQVSDELVMAALKLRPGVRFDPQAFFDFCEAQVTGGGMDRKWFPDFVRIVDEFEYTQTQKVLVRNLKQAHFDRRRLPDAELYWRRRGDTSFRPVHARGLGSPAARVQPPASACSCSIASDSATLRQARSRNPRLPNCAPRAGSGCAGARDRRARATSGRVLGAPTCIL